MLQTSALTPPLQELVLNSTTVFWLARQDMIVAVADSLAFMFYLIKIKILNVYIIYNIS